MTSLPPRPSCLKIASYEDLPIVFSDGGFTLPVSWEPTETSCPDCKRLCIKAYEMQICPRCVLYDQFVKKSRATLANARHAYQLQMKAAA